MAHERHHGGVTHRTPGDRLLAALLFEDRRCALVDGPPTLVVGAPACDVDLVRLQAPPLANALIAHRSDGRGVGGYVRAFAMVSHNTLVAKPMGYENPYG